MGANRKLFDGSVADAVAQSRVIVRALTLAAACSAFVLAYGTSERAAGSTTTQTFTVHVAPGGSARWLSRSESAIERQSVAVRARWGTPLIHFGPGGWPIFVRRGRSSEHLLGWHAVREGRPYVVVRTRTWAPAAGIFDHEILETLVDPYLRHVIRGRLAEVCDPVEGHHYGNGGLLVDWVYPAYFHGSKAGPWDDLRVLARGA